jgi:hypothetical protein
MFEARDGYQDEESRCDNSNKERREGEEKRRKEKQLVRS